MKKLFLPFWKKLYFETCIVAIMLIFGISTFAQSVQFECFTEGESSPTTEPDLINYVPSGADKVKVIRIAFHIMQREGANPQNFQANNSAHTTHLMEIFNRVNALYAFCNYPACGGGYLPMPLDPRDSRIQFELQGIYYHADNVGFINEDGTYGNTYCEKKYGICNVLDVYFCRLNGSTSGYGPGKWALLNNIFNEYINNGASSWGNGNLLGHELGHCFTLYHSWQCDQKARFSDICQGGPSTGCPVLNQYEGPCTNWSDVDDGCYGSSRLFCDASNESRCSNNMMSYSTFNDHISPLQMAAMHKSIIYNNSDALKLEYDNTENITITGSNVIWDIGRVIYGNVYIEPGAKLTIRSKVLFSPESRIVVKRGARLILEGGHLTTAPPAVVNCAGTSVGNRWYGIEVWGNTSVTPTTSMFEDTYTPQSNDPGAAILRKYQNTIPIVENAKFGVQTRRNNATDKPTAAQHGNGLVKAQDTKFLNCRKAAEIYSYFLLDNPSQFIDCEFIQNALQAAPASAYGYDYEGITMKYVKGVSCSGSKFDHLKTGMSGVYSSFSVKTSNFKTNYQGVSVLAPNANFAELTTVGGDLTSDKNTFEDCWYSVVCNGYNRLKVSFNYFKNDNMGVEVEGTSGFQINDNKFEYTGPGNKNFSSAISLTNGGDGFNYSECNEFVGYAPSIHNRINSGVTALGNNRNYTFRKETFDCWRDVQVIKAFDANGTTFTPGRIAAQGTPSNAVRNLFTGVVLNGSTYGWAPGHASDIFTTYSGLDPQESADFSYFYPPTAPAESRMVPKCPLTGLGIIPSVCGSVQYNFNNKPPANDGSDACGSTIINGILEGGPVDCRREACLNGFYSAMLRADSILQVGSAASLLGAILTAPNSSSTIQALLNASPYLSEQVLKDVAGNTSMSGGNKATVLWANVPLSATVLTQALSAISATLYGQLVTASPDNILSKRDSLAADGSIAERYKASILGFLTDSLYRAGNYSQVEYLLQQDPARGSREALIGLKIQRQEYQSAQTLLNAYPTIEQADSDFRQLQLINLRRIMEDDTFQLTVTEDTFLHRQARAYGLQTDYARTLLYLLKGEVFDRIIPVYEVGEERAAPEVEQQAFVSELAESFTLEPNPTSDLVKIVVKEWQSQSDYRVVLRDPASRMFLEIKLDLPLASLEIASIPSGLYFVTLIRDGRPLVTRKLIKH